VNNEHLPASLQEFRERRDSIYAVVNEQPDLTARKRKELIRYMDDFFELIDDERDVERKIYDECI